MKIHGNTILITGGGTGIGRGLAEAFYAHGNQVIIAGRRQQVLDETASANPGMESMTLQVDDPAGIQSLAAQIAARYPALNVVIHNAGIMRLEDLQSGAAHLEDAEAMIATNLLGPIRLTAALLPLLKQQSKATIMTVSSGLAFVPMAVTPTYCATKAAIHSYTLELIPPYVQTELMGEHQAKDPRAMPLDAFIAESIEILKTQPEATEICVKTVDPLRYAAESGRYDATFKAFNDGIARSAAGH
jgi:uncharacterized oxidoreductase